MHLIIHNDDLSWSCINLTRYRTSSLSEPWRSVSTLLNQYASLSALLYRSLILYCTNCTPIFCPIGIWSLFSKWVWFVVILLPVLLDLGIWTEDCMDWAGFEPTTLRMRTEYSTKLNYQPWHRIVWDQLLNYAVFISMLVFETAERSRISSLFVWYFPLGCLEELFTLVLIKDGYNQIECFLLCVTLI